MRNAYGAYNPRGIDRFENIKGRVINNLRSVPK